MRNTVESIEDHFSHEAPPEEIKEALAFLQIHIKNVENENIKLEKDLPFLKM